MDHQETSFSEYGQDLYLDKEIFQGKENGTFVEVGAADGTRLSNTCFFERYRNWKGLCIEPRLSEFKKLIQNRTCLCENICISSSGKPEIFVEFTGAWLPMLSGIERNFPEIHKAKIQEGLSQPEQNHKMKKNEIPSLPLQALLDKYGLYQIDYCCIDTEGSDLEILQSIDFGKTYIEVFTVENNYSNLEIPMFMKSKGYELIKEIGESGKALDQVYKRK